MAFDRNHPLAAIATGIADRLTVRRRVPRLAPDERIDGRVALVTGGASGLGFATCVDLARRGARVLLADVRDLEAARARAASLGIPDGSILPRAVDLSDLESVERLVVDLAREGVRIDRLVLNAAIVPLEARTTRQGLDEMLVVNYLSSFLLVTRLIETGVLPVAGDVRSGDRRGDDVPRVIFVCSEAHRWDPGFEVGPLDAPRDGSPRRVLAFYGLYKRLLATFAWELARRHRREGGHPPRLSVFALCPGAMNTRIARDLPGPLRVALSAVMRLAFQDPFDADEPVLHFACSRAVAGRTAVYLHKMVEKDIDPRAADPAASHALWERSGDMLKKLKLLRQGT